LLTVLFAVREKSGHDSAAPLRETGGRDRAAAPHAVGADDDDGEQDDESEGGLVIGEDEGKGVHPGVEDDCGEKGAAGAVVEPGEDDSDRD
jgi:hypothetical protein